MMAVGLSPDAVQKYLDSVPHGSAVVACVNSPSSVTLSGDVEAINHLETLISEDGKFARKLKVTTAYHSPHMLEVSPKYLEMIGGLTPIQTDGTVSSPVMYSSLTGSMISSAHELDAMYWVNNMQSPVQFSRAILALLKHRRKASGSDRPTMVQWGAFLEVGPHMALQGPLRQIIDVSNNRFAKSAPYASMLVRGKDAVGSSLNAAGILWAAGCGIDMGAINGHAIVKSSTRMVCSLPPYPWNHTRSYWHESYSSRSYRFPSHVRNDFLGMPEYSHMSHEPRWRNCLRISENPWIEDHVITGTVLYPGAGMLVMALEGALRTANPSKTLEGFRLTNVMFERGLVVSMDDEAPVETRISLHPHGTEPDSWTFAIYSMANASQWARNCGGTVALVYEDKASEVEEANVDVLWQKQVEFHHSLLSEAGVVPVNVNEFYKKLDAVDMQYGQSFRNVVSLAAVPSLSASYGMVSVPDTKSIMPMHYESPHVIHPATMDSIFHLCIASLSTGEQVQQAAVPYNIEEMYVARDQTNVSGALYSGYGRLVSQTGHEIMRDLVVSDQEWATPKLTIKNFALRQVTSGNDAQISHDTLSGPVKKCARITWIPDVDFLGSGADVAKLAPSTNAAALVKTWLDSVFLKTSSNTALVALFDDSKASADILLDLRQRMYGPKRIIALATSELRLQSMKEIFGEDAEATAITYKCLPEDVLLQTVATEANNVLIALGVPGIGKNAPILSRLAPVACFTCADPPEQVDAIVPEKKCIGQWGEDATYVLLISGAVPEPAEMPGSVVFLLPASPSKSLLAFAIRMQASLKSFGISITQIELTSDGVALLGTKFVISLLELESPLVYSWNEDQFLSFKTLVSNVGHLFWITRGSLLTDWSNGVEFATAQGLLRVMRNEYPISVLPSLDLSATADIACSWYADLVLSVWRTSLDEHAEMEYAESDGVIYIPRATEDFGFDYELQLAANTAKPVVSALGGLGQPVEASERANADEYIWTPDEQNELPLEADEVEVKVDYVGLGTGHPLKSIRHAIGIVARRGDSVKTFELGQRVLVFSHAAARTHIRQSQTHVTPLPRGLEPCEAVALVEPLVTAQYALVEISRLSQGQVVLLDNAASPAGQGLIQIAKAIGAEIFALVHSGRERDTLADHLGIPRDHILDSNLKNFAPLILDATQNHGVDVVVAQESGPHVAGAMSILDEFGHFIDITGESSKTCLPTSKDNVTLTRFDIVSAMEARASTVGQLFQQAFRQSTLQAPSSLTVLPVTNLSASTSSVQHEHVVVSMSDSSPVLMPAPPLGDLRLDGEATYVLAGGLGALGLDIAKWMTECGAKDLVFLSRSGGAKRQQDLQIFTERSVRIQTLKCNVNDANSVAEVFESIKARGRRVAGMIQLAMVLDDGIFDMSFAQWRYAIEPKTKGSRNLLANIWPGDKPFFILLSSITGVIGNTAQGNYASGNTFEDALAHHARNHLGINATSIDVGLVSDSSHFTAPGQFGDLDSYLGRYQHGWRGLQTNLQELRVVMQAIMRGSVANGQNMPAQVVLGLGDCIEADESAGSFWRDMKFELRRRRTGNPAVGGKTRQDVDTLLSNAATMAEAAAVVEGYIKHMVAAAMGISADEIDVHKPLYDYGG